jgi:peptide/nickel transport system permease protein
VPYGAEPEEPPHSVSYEWSGIVGGSISYLYDSQWIILVPIGFFMMTAICVALINNSISAFYNSRTVKIRKEE